MKNKSTVTLDFQSNGRGIGKGDVVRLSFDGKAVAEGRTGNTQRHVFSADEIADIGVDDPPPIAIAIGHGLTVAKVGRKIHKLLVEVK